MEEIIISVISTILGSVLGWFLNCVYEKKIKKVKLSYSLQQSADINDTDHELRTKYSPSDYEIQIYNVSDTPYILNQISLRYGKHTITDCIITEENKTIMPYTNYTYRLNEQEYDAIKWHCKKANLKECKVVAYDVNGKKCIGTLDLILPYLQSRFR